MLSSCFKVRQDHVIHPKKKTEDMQVIESIANNMVVSNVITEDEANKQVGAVKDFFEGKMTYADMRRIAG